MTDLSDSFAIEQLVARFANSFDCGAWDDLAACLARTLHTDYSDLRGTPPETMSRERFVEMRRIALAGVRTQHLAGNVEVRLDGAHGEARVSMVIYRRSAEGAVFTTHCLYTFGVAKANRQWMISSIVQKVFWNEGERSIHGGLNTYPPPVRTP